MPAVHEADQRLTELEIKASFQEDLLDSLNQVVIRQQQQIDRMIQALSDLKQQLEETDAGGVPRLRDELPPHY